MHYLKEVTKGANYMIKDIVLAGLLHDMGKLVARAKPGKFDNKEHPDFRYPHAKLTYEFLEEHVKWDGSQPKWIHYASKHHKPSDSNPFEWLIAEGDRLASGMDRQEYEQRTVLEDIPSLATALKPVTEFISLKEVEPKERIDGKFSIPLKPLSLDREHFFPTKQFQATLREDYKELYSQFVNEFQKLVSHQINNKIDSLYFLLQKYLWAVPATTKKFEMPDVSLFEHSKMTAAIASALYLYHEHNDSLNNLEHIKNRKIEKYLLFSGDVGGIQKFIYRISSKGAMRQLKGRSFYIQIINDLIAEYICEKIGLEKPNIIYSNGGKFYLLLPNTEKTLEILSKTIKTVNEGLFKDFEGDLFLRTGFVPFSGEDLQLKNGKLTLLWEEVNKKLAQAAFREFDFIMKNKDKFDDFFGPASGVTSYSCSSCYRELSKDNDLCHVCKKLENVGKSIRNANFLIIRKKQEKYDNHFLFLDKSLFFSNEVPPLAQDDVIYKLNDTNLDDIIKSDSFIRMERESKMATLSPFTFQMGYKFYGGNRKLDKTFEDLAQKCPSNFKKLGILRMDVDNLGTIFANGLKYYKVRLRNYQNDNFYSISRMTTLSSQLNMFFAGYINVLAEKYIDENNEYKLAIVYSGGDDLFVVGTWNDVLDFAWDIYLGFKDFTCNNPDFTMSGGFSITGPKFPIYKSSEYAGEAEEKAKKNKLDESKKKDSICIFGKVVFWEEFKKLRQYKEELLQVVTLSNEKAILRAIQKVLWEYDKIKMEYSQQQISMNRIKKIVANERWLWRMVYNFSRMEVRYNNRKDVIQKFRNILLQEKLTNGDIILEALPITTNWVDYLTR